jgi:hypothetical protein
MVPYLRVLQISNKRNVEESTDRTVQPLDVPHKGIAVHTQCECHFPEYR